MPCVSVERARKILIFSVVAVMSATVFGAQNAPPMCHWQGVSVNCGLQRDRLVESLPEELQVVASETHQCIYAGHDYPLVITATWIVGNMGSLRTLSCSRDCYKALP